MLRRAPRSRRRALDHPKVVVVLHLAVYRAVRRPEHLRAVGRERGIGIRVTPGEGKHGGRRPLPTLLLVRLEHRVAIRVWRRLRKVDGVAIGRERASELIVARRYDSFGEEP